MRILLFCFVTLARLVATTTATSVALEIPNSMDADIAAVFCASGEAGGNDTATSVGLGMSEFVGCEYCCSILFLP